MPSITDLIDYHHENEYLDFKREEYKDLKKHELIKDVLAFANAEHQGDRYIIFGIEKQNNEVKVYPIENPLDSSDIQTYVHEYIKPDLKIEYYPFDYQGKNLMVLCIKSPVQQPYAIKKTLTYFQGKKSYLKDSMVIRKGSRAFDLSLEDLNRIYENKHRELNPFENKVNISFSDEQQTLDLKSIRGLIPPSVRETRTIVDLIGSMEQLLKDDPQGYLRYIENHNYGNGNSLVGLGLPQLKERLKNVHSDKAEEDKYFYLEETSHKLQFYIHNNANQPLKNAVVVISFKAFKGLNIVDKIPFRPTLRTQTAANFEMIRYPQVERPVTEIRVTETVGDVQHKLESEVLKSKLRIWFDEDLADRTIEVAITLHSENLPEPISFMLYLKIKP
jgi:hypothetical protein